jgi:hypothetical protein
VLTHPVGHASYAVRVPQYRYLQSGLLQCMDRSKPPCRLLMLRVTNPAHKRLSLFGFLFLRTIFTIQGTHSVFIKLWLDVKHSTINRYFAFVVIETEVFQLPQLHKHFHVVGNELSNGNRQTNRKEITRNCIRRF